MGNANAQAGRSREHLKTAGAGRRNMTLELPTSQSRHCGDNACNVNLILSEDHGSIFTPKDSKIAQAMIFSNRATESVDTQNVTKKRSSKVLSNNFDTLSPKSLLSIEADKIVSVCDTMKR